MGYDGYSDERYKCIICGRFISDKDFINKKADFTMTFPSINYHLQCIKKEEKKNILINKILQLKINEKIEIGIIDNILKEG